MTNPNDRLIVISDGFEFENINAKVWLSRHLKINDSDKVILQNFNLKSFEKNESEESVLFGNSYGNKYGWIYFRLTNQSNKAKKMVVETTTHLRCDGFKGYILQDSTMTSFGEIKRETPLYERFYPFVNFAIPFNIQPRDTLNVILRSERLSSINEVSLQLSEEKIFLKKLIFSDYERLFQVLFALASMVLVLSLGFIFKQKILIYYGFFLVGLTLLFAVSCSLYDSLDFPEAFALRTYNIGSFLAFLTNALFHPFGYELVHKLPINHKRYILWAKIIVGLNLIMMIAVGITQKIDYILPSIFAILAIINFTWILYHAILAYLRAKIKYFLIVAILTCVPVILKTIVPFFQLGTQYPALNLNYFNIIVIILALTYMTIEQFRKELVSKQNYEQNLNQLRITMNDIRKSEIETIGRNLHDQVGNTLASALGYLNMKTIKIEVVRSLILESINEIRFLSHNLVKDDDKPLTEKIEELVNRFNDFSSIIFQYNDFTNGNVNQLQPLKQQNIYMIIQEILTNIIRHSKAREAYIQVFERDKIIQINIEDDGIGIDNYQINGGIGLKNINKRAKLANLHLTIDSTSKGTNIIIEERDEDKSNNHR
ncbi:MAG: ATP-binding protein [Bacteroidota bacterium]